LPKPPTIDDKALAAVDRGWRSAREIHAILDEGRVRFNGSGSDPLGECW
jgi:hypothetical protein